MIKQIISSFIGAFVAFALVAGLSLVYVTNYAESKLVVLDRVELLIETSADKIDTIFDVLSKGVTGIDTTITNTKVYDRFFGTKE